LKVDVNARQQCDERNGSSDPQWVTDVLLILPLAACPSRAACCTASANMREIGAGWITTTWRVVAWKRALSVFLLIVTECASWFPARRATRIDLVIARRAD
jgi:hypothetical protein